MLEWWTRDGDGISRACTCTRGAPREIDLLSLKCYNAASKCVYDVNGHDMGVKRRTITSDGPRGFLLIRRLCRDRGICASDNVHIKHIKIQAGTRNTRLHYGLYLSACFLTRECKNRSLRMFYHARCREQSGTIEVHLRCTILG